MSVTRVASNQLEKFFANFQLYLSMFSMGAFEFPTIAQLVERPTVVFAQPSDGPWFESGLSDLFY